MQYEIIGSPLDGSFIDLIGAEQGEALLINSDEISGSYKEKIVGVFIVEEKKLVFDGMRTLKSIEKDCGKIKFDEGSVFSEEPPNFEDYGKDPEF